MTCGTTGVKTFFYRYTSPLTSKLVQLKIGNFLLEEMLRMLRQEQFGASSEKNQSKQLNLFNEVETVRSSLNYYIGGGFNEKSYHWRGLTLSYRPFLCGHACLGDMPEKIRSLYTATVESTNFIWLHSA